MNAVVVSPDRTGSGVRVEADRVTEVSRAPRSDDALVLDGSGALIRPGAVNAHTHLYSGLAPLGMPPPNPEPETFVQILERVWWRLDRALDAVSLRASARLYVAQALLAGTTTLVDHHESPEFIEGSLDVLADACQELGCRALLTYGATERNGGRDEARRGLAECRRFLASNDRPLVRGLVGLHASFTVSDATIREAGELCAELGVPMHVHMAEDAADVQDAQARGYAGPLERLLDLGALPPGSILAHGVHLTEDQVRRAVDHGLWFVQNPRSNRGNRVGYPSSLHVSDRVALGTDGYPADMNLETVALLEEASRYGDPDSLAGERRRAGWKLAGERLGRALGNLDTGSTADLGAVSSAGVRHVLVGGRVVVRDGQLVEGDMEDILSSANKEAGRLWKRLPPN